MNSMSDETFIDTNALIHAHDIDATTRHQIARAALRERRSKRTGVLSMQWLEESCANVTRNIPIPPSKDLARLELSRFAIWCIETTPTEMVFRIEDESRIGFWDAVVVSSVAKNGATRMLSEDLGAGQQIAGILIENPFVGVH
jgi:predicted nucleic acid-binding protein